MTAYPDIAIADDPEQFVWELLREGKIDPRETLERDHRRSGRVCDWQ